MITTLNHHFYATQANSGFYSQTNCAPACVAMALRYQRDVRTSVHSIRDSITASMFWNDYNVRHALDFHRVVYRKKTVAIQEDLDALLYSYVYGEAIVIVNVNMWQIARGRKKNKPYSTVHPWWRHYLVIAGATEDKYLILDPYSGDNKVREYDKEQIINSIRQTNINVTLVERGQY